MPVCSVSPFIWMFIIPMFAVLIPVWIGQRIGHFVKKRGKVLPEAPISAAVNSTLGLSAFMLAFTFNIVGNRYETQRVLLREEMSDIRVAYLDAGLVPEPFRSKSRKHIVDYVDLRVELRNDMKKYPEVKQKSFVILDSLWGYAEQLAVIDRSSEAFSLYMSSMANLVRQINNRIVVTDVRLNKTILFIMGFVTIISMLAIGFQFGISGKASIIILLLLGAAFASVVWLIYALDNPESGVIRLSYKPLMSLYEELHGK